MLLLKNNFIHCYAPTFNEHQSYRQSARGTDDDELDFPKANEPTVSALGPEVAAPPLLLQAVLLY